MSVKRRNVSEIAEIHFQTATLWVRMSSSSFVKVFCNGSFTARPQVITSRNLAILSALSSLHSDQMSSREDHLIQLKTLFFFIQGAFRYRTLLSASWKSHIKNGYRCAEGRCDLTSKKSWPLISTPDTLIRFRNSLSWFVITAKQELHFHLTLNI